MNERLALLHPYPFQRFNKLLEGVRSKTDQPLIAWSMGEPKHPAADFLVDLLCDPDVIRQGYGTYPPTRGLPELREAISAFITTRFKLTHPIDPETEVLPVTGTREALFAFAQAIAGTQNPGKVLMPNPFYQIYEGAALLAGCEPVYLNCDADNNYLPDISEVSDDTWRACDLLYLCSPGNPTGAVLSKSALQEYIRLARTFNFVIASDECYSEIYQDESNPPCGLLEAANDLGDGYKNCIAFNSLSKRSNLPGLRSGYVAGDAEIIERFLLYRTYHGSAMPVHHQIISTAAWADEQHVIDNRAIYRQKFTAVSDILAPVWPMETPPAGFYFWPETPFSDTEFAVKLIELANVKVLPGSFLSRDTAAGNPGQNRVRMALVAPLEDCVDAASRIRDVWPHL